MIIQCAFLEIKCKSDLQEPVLRDLVSLFALQSSYSILNLNSSSLWESLALFPSPFSFKSAVCCSVFLVRYSLHETAVTLVTPIEQTCVCGTGHPRPFTSDLAIDQLHRDFPGASGRKSAVLRKQLFHHSSMVLTRTMAGTSSNLDNSSSESSGPSAPPIHRTPPDQLLNNLIIHEAPRAPREPRERDPPDLQNVVTQQTEILAGMLAEFSKTLENDKHNQRLL